MTKIMNKTLAFRRAQIIHEYTLDFSDFEYLKLSSKSTVVCLKCGNSWLTSITDLCRGGSCTLCGERIKITKDVFVYRSSIVHNNFYDYSISIINNGNRGSTDIICPIHGKFTQLITHHMNGVGCPTCARARSEAAKYSNTSEFISDSIFIHGTKYNYNKSVYENCDTPVEIFCNSCQTYFWQTPDAHKSGKGCNSCALSGYKTTKRGSLYILKSGDITKVGITNKEVLKRVREINKDSNKDFKIVYDFKFQDGRIPRFIETRILRIFRSTYESVSDVFDGSTESFLNVDLEMTLKHIAKLCYEFYSKQFK